MKKLSPYAVMTIISVIIRQFFLPNPFECFGDNAAAINWIAEPIIQIVVYGIVGLFYVKGSAPAWGSFLYLILYALTVGVLWVLGLAKFAWWAILIACVAIAFIGFLIFMACQTREEYD